MNWHELHPKDLVLSEDQNQIKNNNKKISPLKISLFFRLSSSVEIRLKQTSYCSHLCSVWEQQELSPLLAVGCCTVVFSPWFCQVCGKSALIMFPLLGARNRRNLSCSCSFLVASQATQNYCSWNDAAQEPALMLLSTPDLHPLSLG